VATANGDRNGDDIGDGETGGNLSNCKGGCPTGEVCVGNPFSQVVHDWSCSQCEGDRDWWPCNFETLCFCNPDGEGAPRIPPAPKTNIHVNRRYDVCHHILTEDVFNSIVQPATDEGRNLYTYAGLCEAITQYNLDHDEKFAGMGNEAQIRTEIAAFLAHTAADTEGYSVIRESRHCVDPITGTDGKVYCKPCKEEHFRKSTGRCEQDYFASEARYEEYCDLTKTLPQGCSCGAHIVRPVHVPMPVDSDVDTTGYIKASKVYFTRGAIQISWNIDYYGASQSMLGDGTVLCNNPDLVSTRPKYAWGVGIYKWMEKLTFGTWGVTAHQQIMDGNFGGSVQVLYGTLECPALNRVSRVHAQMVHTRVAEVCKSGSALGVYLEMDKNCGNRTDCLQCEGLAEIFETCQQDGTCPNCTTWAQSLQTMSPTVAPPTADPSSAPSLSDNIWVPTGDQWWNRDDESSSMRLGAWSFVSLSFVLLSAGSLFA